MPWISAQDGFHRHAVAVGVFDVEEGERPEQLQVGEREIVEDQERTGTLGGVGVQRFL